MKTSFRNTAAMLIAGLLISTAAFSQSTNGRNFVDKDKNGVCDNQKNVKARSANGRNFVDANADGVCDNQAAGQGKGKGKGNGQGCRYRGGRK